MHELHRAMRARAEQLNISRETIDHVSGLPSGYSAKLLAPKPLKCVGLKSMMPLLGTLALKLHVVHDEEAFQRIKRRLEPADSDRQRWDNKNWKTHMSPRYRA